MGGTGIRCLFDSARKQRCLDTSKSKKKGCREVKEEELSEREVTCEKVEVCESKPCDIKCECMNVVEVVACCKPGCSVRMPCLACTRSGCKAVIPCKVLRKRDCTCAKSKCETKNRSRSEGRIRAKSTCREIAECCDLKPKKKICDSRKKVCREEESCEETISSSDCCETTVTPSCFPPILVECAKPKSPCRKLNSCPCDSCKSVTFQEKCEVIPDQDGDSSSCSDETTCCKTEKVQCFKRVICTVKNPCKLSTCTKACCNPIETITETICHCNVCETQNTKNKCGRQRPETCEVITALSQMCPPTYVMPNTNSNMSRTGNNNWPKEITCPCGPCEIPNYTNSLYQNSYPLPSYNRF
jgi:hypothetical protein